LHVGEKIKEIRLKKGMKQSDLAEKSRISRVAIGNYERNDRQPGTEQIVRIASALEVSPVDLMGWDYWDVKYPDVAVKNSEDQAMLNYLKLLGFAVEYEVTKWHYEDEVDDSGKVIGKSQVEDEGVHILIKNGHSATFSQEDLDDLQSATKEVIEGKFYKKVLQNDKK